MEKGKAYVLDSNLRIFDNNLNEIRLRMGLWNYNEAVLQLDDQTDEFKNVFRIILNDMKNGSEFKLETLENYDISQQDKNNLINTFEALHNSGMICSKDENDITNEINKILLGNFRYIAQDNKKEGIYDKKALFICDSSYEESTAKEISKSIGLKLDICSKELKRDILKRDLTSNLDALETKKNIEELTGKLKEYSSILIGMQHPNMSLLRNLNRLLLHMKKPAVTAFLDGPFITIFSINPPKTGCLECFEQRILSRMEDHVLYHEFVKSDNGFNENTNKGMIPLLNIITNLVVCEGFLINNAGGSKFEGRVLSIFIPTLEIQVQDLLRVPFCPGCGNVSKAKLKEINISSRRIVDGIINELNL
ncbi:streptolysin associated protein SagC [Haloimpatiens sp. FM7330]|uniref:streptolysin associated protein SagC n=1 Tax=Haloimpatiens sp. FM7330 TaxID=3298610 RepID=UPI003638466B